jgi:hypothetical protein
MPTRRKKKKTAEWTVFVRHVATGHGRRTQERDLVKTGHKKPQSSKQRAKKGPPKKKKNGKKRTWSKLGTKNPKVQSKGPKKGHPKKKKKREKKKKKVYIQRHMLFGKIVLVHKIDMPSTPWYDFSLVA